MHLNVKSANVMLTGDLRTAKLADFGLLRIIHGQNRDSQCVCRGTPGWTAPEVLPLSAVELWNAFDWASGGDDDCLVSLAATQGNQGLPVCGKTGQTSLQICLSCSCRAFPPHSSAP